MRHLLLCGLALTIATAAGATESGVTVLTAARIHTSNPQQPQVQALYQFELLARPRGKRWYLSRRVAEEDSPNVDSVRWFVREVIHLSRLEFLGARLHGGTAQRRRCQPLADAGAGGAALVRALPG